MKETMKSIASEYKAMAERSQFLWKGCYTDIFRIIETARSRAAAAKELRKMAEITRAMSVSGAYLGAAERIEP